MYTASAPGSLMLMGEYAVLHGHLALCASINKRITISITPRKDTRILIESALGHAETELTHFTITPPFEFLLTALQQANITQGCDIQITSEFSHKQGLGSSAAVTVATVAAIEKWQHNTLHKPTVFQKAKHVIQTVQGNGSGADVAASTFGAIVCYQFGEIASLLTQLPPLTVVFSGEKTTTQRAIPLIESRFKHTPELLASLLSELGALSVKAKHAIAKENWHELGALFNAAQTVLTQLGVSTPPIDKIIEQLNSDSTILGSKISGSGLGDCVIGLGQSEGTFNNQLNVSLATTGVM